MSDSSRDSTPSPSGSRPFLITRRRRSNADYGESLASKLQQSGMYSIDVYRWEDDDLSLRCAAAQARLPFDRMTEEELKAFPSMARTRASTTLFLYLRNKILVLWHLDPLVELTVEAVLKEIPPPFNSDTKTVINLHAHLQRYGYINYGVFIGLSNMRLEERKHIIVVGAGAAGLAAARQLKFFGFDVTVIEARPRVGGRVMTYKSKYAAFTADGKPCQMAADLGAQVVVGITGNPIITLVQQLPVQVVKISQKCPIYDPKGQIVDPRKDDMIQKSFNKILETCSYIAHELGVTEIGGEKLSLGEAYHLLLDQLEHRVQKKRLAYWQRYRDLCLRMKKANRNLAVYRSTIHQIMTELRKFINVESATAESIAIDYANIKEEADFYRALSIRSLRQTLQLAVQSHDEVAAERADMERVLAELKKMEPSHVYMNATDKRILDFHFANLEYATGAKFSAISLKEWDQDDVYEFEGSHMIVREGYGAVIQELSKSLDPQLNCIVEAIRYSENGARVEYSTKDESGKIVQHTVEGDAVVCTVPLGILKRSAMEEPLPESISFDPPLPDWKCKAIASLGYGSLNKIALMFEKPFWDQSLNVFGRLNDSTSSRGEMFLFFSNGETPVLTGLLAGEAAAIGDRVKEEMLVRKAMSILGSIYGAACPKSPQEFIVTLWHHDRFARGCYSYIGTNSSAADYDVLAKPVCDSHGLPRLCFAGEHTNRRYPSTVHGAFLSGMREAARIADSFIGPAVSTAATSSDDELMGNTEQA